MPSKNSKYTGKWEVKEGDEPVGIPGDKGLTVGNAAKHHGIAAPFTKILDNTGKDLVVQYEVRLQNLLDCGGAYMKLLTASNEKVEDFHDKTPYTIMFGPDKCGVTNKVHFIFRHKNPKTGVVEEKHLKNPPSIKSDKLSHLYTLVVKKDNSFEIFIDQESVRKGSLLKDFDPAVNPPETIDDPTDQKPEDWVDEKEIQDPAATKPDDWDEDAPREIEDADAEKPEDWLDDEPEYVSDPDAKMPEDWDEEEDGSWEAPKIANPKCEAASGCGEWKRPTIKNPKYKGKWTAPMIPNPAYKGEWTPKQIPNPDYFYDATPANFTPMDSVAFELWTMNDGIAFDNIVIGHDVKAAQKFAKDTWKVKKAAQDSVEKAKEEKAKKAAEEHRKSDEKLELEKAKTLQEKAAVYGKIAMRYVQENPLLVVGTSFAGIVLLVILTFLRSPGDPPKSREPPSRQERTAAARADDSDAVDSGEESAAGAGVAAGEEKAQDTVVPDDSVPDNDNQLTTDGDTEGEGQKGGQVPEGTRKRRKNRKDTLA